MEDNFKLEIISPEKIIFSDEIKMATLPSYEGEMSILKDHISIINFNPQFKARYLDHIINPFGSTLKGPIEYIFNSKFSIENVPKK